MRRLGQRAASPSDPRLLIAPHRQRFPHTWSSTLAGENTGKDPASSGTGSVSSEA